jgi:HEAT repeat protein
VEEIIPPPAFEPRERNGNPPLDAARERAVEEVIRRLLAALESPQERTVQEATRNLKSLAETILRQADLDLLSRLLDLLPPDSPRAEVHALRDHLLGSEALGGLAAHFLQEDEWPELALSLFCNRLDDAVMPLFLRPLLAAPAEKLDRLLGRLARFRGGALAALGRELGAGQMGGILRLAKEAGGDGLLDRFARHPDGAVRLEILRMLDAVTDAHLAAALKDPDPSVRMHALSVISKEQRSSLVGALTEGITGEGFASRDAQEREKWVVVAAMVGRAAVEDFFIRFLEAKGLFTSGREEEMKALAARALGIIGGEKSLPVLQRESKRITSPGRVRQSCAVSREVILKKRKPHE